MRPGPGLIGDPAAAKPLAEVLRQEGMTGYVHDTVGTAVERDRESPGGTNAVQTRRDSLRELLLARALYRCGDYEGLGEQILKRTPTTSAATWPGTPRPCSTRASGERWMPHQYFVRASS